MSPRVRKQFWLESIFYTLNKVFTAKHTFHWNKGYEFSSFLPQDKEEDFKTVILEGLEMAKHQVRVAFWCLWCGSKSCHIWTKYWDTNPGLDLSKYKRGKQEGSLSSSVDWKEISFSRKHVWLFDFDYRGGGIVLMKESRTPKRVHSVPGKSLVVKALSYRSILAGI